MELKDTYTRIARDWHNDHQSDTWWVEGTDHFMSALATGARVLDIGCGTGSKSRYLVDKGLCVTGIDFSEGFLEIAREEVPEAEFILTDMREIDNLPLYDGLFAQASLLHIPRAEMKATLEILESHLAPGGYFYAAVKGVRPGSPLEEVKQENDYGYPYERFFSYYTLEELQAYFQELGLEVVFESAEIIRKTEWIQIIGKKR